MKRYTHEAAIYIQEIYSLLKSTFQTDKLCVHGYPECLKNSADLRRYSLSEIEGLTNNLE